MRYGLIAVFALIAIFSGMLMAPNLASAGSRYAATLTCAVSIAASACGGVRSGTVPSPSPVTATSVNAAIEHSTMRNGHFSVVGTFLIKGANIPATGTGVEQIRPSVALQVRLTLPNPRGGTIVVQSVVVGGRVHTRVGSAKWTSEPETFTPTTSTSYVGEEKFGPTTTWRVHCETPSSTLDTWVREADGYFVYQKFTNPNASLWMTFDSYNRSPVITAP